MSKIGLSYRATKLWTETHRSVSFRPFSGKKKSRTKLGTGQSAAVAGVNRALGAVGAEQHCSTPRDGGSGTGNELFAPNPSHEDAAIGPELEHQDIPRFPVELFANVGRKRDLPTLPYTDFHDVLLSDQA
jgi:hypothetical protein